jgi:hypothetical protein
MPIGPQPRKARGTVERPYSALNLRLLLASFGLLASAVLAGLAFRLRYPWFGWALVVLAAVAAVDLVVIQLRRRRRNGRNYSLFE